MAFTLKRAGLLSPKTLRNEIVQDYDFAGRRNRPGTATAASVFPMEELSNSTETFFRRDGIRPPMRSTSLVSESPITDIESLTEDEVSVDTYKRKISPEKGVDTELNSDEEIFRLFQEAANELREDIARTREIVAWRGDDTIDGMIGADGVSAHPGLDSSHVITPATAYDDAVNSAPQDDFQYSQFLIDDEGSALDRAGELTAYMSPSVMFDLMQNDDLEGRFSGVEVQGLTQEQVASVLPFQNIEQVHLKTPRTDSDGALLAADGTKANTPEEVAKDNLLEPYDPSTDSKHRNIVIGRPGRVSAFTPWFLDRLAEHAENVPPGGEFALDTNAGFMTQTWTTNDPVVSWLKVAFECGFHLHRPGNWVLIQDI